MITNKFLASMTKIFNYFRMFALYFSNETTALTAQVTQLRSIYSQNEIIKNHYNLVVWVDAVTFSILSLFRGHLSNWCK